jgi:hypothetical protein
MRRLAHILSRRVAAAAILLLLGVSAPVPASYAQAVQAASSPSTAVQSPVLTPEQQRAQRLRDEASQLDDLTQQLQHEMRKAGDDKLSLEAVRLAQQIQWLSRQIQAELRQP